MKSLIERIDEIISSMIVYNKFKPYKDIYNHKLIAGFQKESIHLSFRFYNDKHEYYILTFITQLREDKPYVCFILSKLDDKRYFFNTVKMIKKEIDKKQTLPTLFEDQALLTYCKNHKHLPPTLLFDQYENIKDEILSSIE